jgi:hypothetical protein
MPPKGRIHVPPATEPASPAAMVSSDAPSIHNDTVPVAASDNISIRTLSSFSTGSISSQSKTLQSMRDCF